MPSCCLCGGTQDCHIDYLGSIFYSVNVQWYLWSGLDAWCWATAKRSMSRNCAAKWLQVCSGSLQTSFNWGLRSKHNRAERRIISRTQNFQLDYVIAVMWIVSQFWQPLVTVFCNSFLRLYSEAQRLSRGCGFFWKDIGFIQGYRWWGRWKCYQVCFEWCQQENVTGTAGCRFTPNLDFLTSFSELPSFQQTVFPILLEGWQLRKIARFYGFVLWFVSLW